MLNRVASIVPIPHLDLIQDDTYFMALTHLLDDPQYFWFYRTMVEMGRYVILDNSTVELGHPADPVEYIENAVRLGASEILLPDWLRSPERTLKAGDKFIYLVAGSNYTGRLMAVPQGANVGEWAECARIMLKWPIHSLGLSRRYWEFAGVYRRRGVQILSELCMEAGRTDVKVHLLGCAGLPEDDVAPSLGMDIVQGVDSSLAAQFTAAGLHLAAGVPRPPVADIPWDFNTKYGTGLMRTNLRAWRNLCSGV